MLKYSGLDTDNQYISDWIAGFVDYQDDQDWNVLDIEPMIPAGGSGIPEDWYYDIEARFHTPGSDVEYTWKLYRDVSRGGAPNQVVVERTPGTIDIDYMNDRDGAFNPVPDDDWGYDAPYYFQVRLTFHPDVSNP